MFGLLGFLPSIKKLKTQKGKVRSVISDVIDRLDIGPVIII